MDKWHRIPDVARDRQISRSKLYQLIAQGEVKVVRIGRSVRITDQALREWQERLGA